VYQLIRKMKNNLCVVNYMCFPSSKRLNFIRFCLVIWQSTRKRCVDRRVQASSERNQKIQSANCCWGNNQGR